MPRTAKIFMMNRSQAVRLPKEFQFDSDEVFIRKEGEDVILPLNNDELGAPISIAAPSRPRHVHGERGGSARAGARC